MQEIMKDKKCTETNIGLYKCEPCSGMDDPTFPTLDMRMGSP